MPKLKTAEQAYDECLTQGFINEIGTINREKASSLAENAETSISTAQIIIKAIDKKAKEWLSVYTHYYEALRMLTEALLIFNKVSISNHQCLFACLCTHHPDLELDWDFFEKIRTKRNKANYYGEQINYDDWREAETQLKLYISTIKKEIDKRLREE
jgi:hypothetical protein